LGGSGGDGGTVEWGALRRKLKKKLTGGEGGSMDGGKHEEGSGGGGDLKRLDRIRVCGKV